MADPVLDPTAVRRRFSALAGGFAFLDAPGGSQVPDSVGDAVARALREASANMGARVRDEPPRRRDRHRGGGEGRGVPRLRAPRGDLRAEHDLAELHALAHRRPRLRAGRRDPRLLARPRRRRRAVARAGARPRPARPAHRARARTRRSTTTTCARKLTERTRVVAFAWASNAIGTIVDAARVVRARALGRRARAGSTRCTTPRTSRSTCARSTPTCCCARRTSSAGRTSAWPTGAPSLLESLRPYKARPAPINPLGRRFETGTLPYELLAGFNATIDYLDEIGGMEAIVPYERALGERFLATLPECVTSTGCRRSRAACRRSC